MKKLAVLGLAVSVSGGAVASAQMSEREAKKQLSAMSSLERLIETNGDEDKRQRLNALNSDIEKAEKRLNTLQQQFEKKNRQLEEKERQLKEKKRQLEEKKRQAEEQRRQAEGMLDQISRHRCWGIENFLLSEANDLAAEINTLLKETKTLRKEINTLQIEINTLLIEQNTLLRQRNALRDELEGEISEAHRDQAELMDLAVAEASRQNIPVHEFAPRFFANIGLPQEAIQNIMRLFGHGQQQNQQPQHSGISFNPLNWFK